MLDAFFEQMKTLLNKDEFADFMNALDQPPYQAMHINTNKDPEHKIAQLFKLNQHPYVSNGYYFNKDTLPLGRLAYHDAGLYYIQEPSAMLVAQLANLKPGMRVLDMCGAPGGKSSKAALAIGKDGLLITNDISASRAKILSENIERFGLTNTIVTNTNPKQLAQLLPGFFDAVIVDAPCSGEGMFRKLNQAKTTWSLEKVDECSKIQRELLDYACTLLKDNGILMYSTCTYETKENEEQIRYALDNLPLTLEPIDMQPGFCPGINLDGVVRLYPHHFNGEGHFIAKMIKQKNDGITPMIPTIKSNLTKSQLTLLTDFWKKTIYAPIPECLYASNDHLYAVPAPYLDLKGIRILRQGLYLGECKKNRFEPSHSLALALQPNEVMRSYNFALDSNEIKSYLHGETLEGNLGNGFGLVLVDGYPLGFVKEVNGVLKNYYPKGLRK